MQLGFRLYRELTTKGHAPIEVYPHAGFRLLSSASLPKKTTMAGVRERVARRERGEGFLELGFDPGQ